MADTQIATRIRRTHLGIRYDLYSDGTYFATASTAKEIEPLIERLLVQSANRHN